MWNPPSARRNTHVPEIFRDCNSRINGCLTCRNRHVGRICDQNWLRSIKDSPVLGSFSSEIHSKRPSSHCRAHRIRCRQRYLPRPILRADAVLPSYRFQRSGTAATPPLAIGKMYQRHAALSQAALSAEVFLVGTPAPYRPLLHHLQILITICSSKYSHGLFYGELSFAVSLMVPFIQTAP